MTCVYTCRKTTVLLLARWTTVDCVDQSQPALPTVCHCSVQQAVVVIGRCRIVAVEAASKVRFIYEKAQAYELVHATSGRGAVTPGGDIMFELYLEAVQALVEETYELKPNGSLGKQVPSEPSSEELRVSRTLEVAVAVSLEDAGKIADWLKEKCVEGQARRAMIATTAQEDENG